MTLCPAWEADDLLGMAALKQLDPRHGEIKSMRIAPAARRYRIEARRRGYARTSLETGSAAPFAPARAMYAAAGFATCAPFAGYTDRVFSRNYTRTL